VLPPPPERRLPPWVEGVRGRIGLDGRALAWIGVVVVAVLVGAWSLRPAPVPVEETLPMASASEPGGPPAPTSPGAAGSGPVPPGSGPPGSGPPGSGSSVPGSSVPVEVVVHAAGAVAQPGVYVLDPGARVDDLVQAAGGLAPDADAGRINLAAPLSDGARVYVPRLGEAGAPAVVGADPGAPPDGGAGPTEGATSPGSTGSADGAPAALVDLNTATEAELEELPGVGPAIAAAIVAFRQENGGFATVEDLLDVRGIGEARLDEIRPLVTV